MRDREIVQRVKDATDLVALVGQAVKLRQQGSAWSGLCPFHSERTPSFQVVPDRGFYHCFGCGKHGDAFTWIMEREGLTFPEALEQLASSAGVELPKRRERSMAEVDLETRLRSALDAAQAFYVEQRKKSPRAQAYLEGRSLSGAFIEDAGFGHAPDAWEALVTHLRGLGFSFEVLEQCGLASRSERGSLIDFLRNRLTIPIHDARGRLIAFGGRAFGDEKPKYLNTRETTLFSKSHVLFGFHRAKGQLRDGALVVEGYFDVLQLHQAGIRNAVAPLGTALTEGHLQQIGRFTKRLILCFDGDAAGQKAMEKGLRLALPAGFDVRLLVLPSGEDPDTWCLKLGAEGFRELMLRAPDWTSFIIDHALEGKDINRIPDRMAALRSLAEYLVFLPNTVERRELFASLAHQLRIPLVEFERAVKLRRSEGGEADDAHQAPEAPERPEVDDLLRPILILCRDAAFRRELERVPAAWWEPLVGAPMLQAVLDADGDPDQLPPEVLAHIRYLESAWADEKNDSEFDPGLYILKLEVAYVSRELQAVTRQLLDPALVSDEATSRKLNERAADLLLRERALKRRRRDAREGGFVDQ
ncbi:MAG TPA: DNA primase [Holophaga sp.]|nr:DNA primase [Holophaga sp.]